MALRVNLNDALPHTWYEDLDITETLQKACVARYQLLERPLRRLGLAKVSHGYWLVDGTKVRCALDLADEDEVDILDLDDAIWELESSKNTPQEQEVGS